MSDIICEPDEYARLVMELKASGIIKDQGGGLLSRDKKNSFKGKDFVNWVTKTKHLGIEDLFMFTRLILYFKFRACRSIRDGTNVD